MSKMKSKYQSGLITIQIPADLIRFAQKNNPNFPMKISKKDLDKLGEYVAKNILSFGEDQEDGTTRFEQLLDDLIVAAYEDGEKWIKEIEY